MIHTEYDPSANVVPGDGERLGDIMPPDEGVFIDDNLPSNRRRLERWNEAAQDAHYEALMDEEDKRRADEIAVVATSAHVRDRTDRDVPQPLMSEPQIATNKKWITHFRQNGFKNPL